jgi:hypothetical protein
MAAEPFNSLGGLTTGIPPVPVIDANGNVITNVNAPSANVSANRIFANYYLYANGQSIIASAAGSNTEIQFNDNGQFGASSALTFTSTSNTLSVSNLQVSSTTNLGNVENITILGGDNGYVLQTDGAGNLSWTAQTGNGGNGNGTPGGSNTQVQYNDSGSFGGDPGFTYDENLNLLTVGNLTVIDTITGNLTGTASQSNTANTVTNNAQPNITSLGTLTSLIVSGDANAANVNATFVNVSNTLYTYDLSATGTASLTTANISGNLSAANASLGNSVTANFITATVNLQASNAYFSSNATILGNLGAGNISTAGAVAATNVTITGNANVAAAGVLRVLGDVNFSGAVDVDLGNISNLHIGGGVNGYVLSTDGTGNLTWIAGGGGGNGTPGGSNTQVQYNDTGTFGGSAFFTFNEATNNVNIAGNLIANSVTMGSGVYQFSHSNVYFATTNSTTPDQLLLAIESEDIAAVDYTIISTDNNIRNFIKISCVLMGTTLNYVEYSTLPVNGYTGDFTVEYDPGGVLDPPTIQLKLTPQSSNAMTHKMMVTSYKE